MIVNVYVYWIYKRFVCILTLISFMKWLQLYIIWRLNQEFICVVLHKFDYIPIPRQITL